MHFFIVPRQVVTKFKSKRHQAIRNNFESNINKYDYLGGLSDFNTYEEENKDPSKSDAFQVDVIAKDWQWKNKNMTKHMYLTKVKQVNENSAYNYTTYVRTIEVKYCDLLHGGEYPFDDEE